MADATTTYAMKGRLTFSRSGWLLLEVPNAIGNGYFQALSEHGIEQPISETHGRYNAHVSVMRPDEIESVGGPDVIKARGQTIGFNLGAVREIANPAGWADVSKVWIIEVKSPELMKLRRSLGLGEPKHPFHITFAIRKKNALKSASIIHFDKVAAQRTEIKSSPIEGKGLFATVDFQNGDVIQPHFMTLTSGEDSHNVWDQCEECRFTNHSDNPNCRIVRDDGYVKLVADRDIVKGEELTADYDSCSDICGPDFSFTYRGKAYKGESSTELPGSEVHPTSASILHTLSGAEDGDGSGDQDDDARRASFDHHSGAGAEAVGADHRGVSEAGLGSVAPDADSGFDHHSEKTAHVLISGSNHGGSAGTGIQVVPDGQLVSGYGWGELAGSGWGDAGGLHLKEAVNRNQPDYGKRLKRLYDRQRKCLGCDRQFKPDEPYPDVQMCEACERFGPPKLVKEGTDLAVQIANARKDTAKPTPAQAAAGNYAKGKVKMHGMQFTIETPKGFTRSGVSKSGVAWSNKMTADYGYINGTEGKDGDHVDVFIGPDPEAEMVFVVDQVDPDNGRFDEHKVMFGYRTEADAQTAYLAHYSAGWKGLKNITPLTMRQFRWWLDKGDQNKPMDGAAVKTAAGSFYLNAMQQTPFNYDAQSGMVGNLLQHLGNVKARGDRAITEAGSLDRIQNAMDPNRPMQQLSGFLSGQRQPIVNHPLDRTLSEIP